MVLQPLTGSLDVVDGKADVAYPFAAFVVATIVVGTAVCCLGVAAKLEDALAGLP
jgi:hypothetical protein